MFKLPDKNCVISFSGGRTSGFMLYKIIQENHLLDGKCKVIFANTGREMPETLDFVKECEDRWGIEIVWLEYTRVDGKVTFKVVDYETASRNGEPFERLLEKGNALPNVMWRFCTVEMKIKTIKRYLISQGWDQWANVVGIRADESHRAKTSNDKKYENFYPLISANISKNDVLNFWSNNNFDLRVVKGGGNCDGCFLKSEATLAAMFREYPERMRWWIEAEKRSGLTFHKSRSYEELGNFVERQKDWIFNDESYLCQAKDGECT